MIKMNVLCVFSLCLAATVFVCVVFPRQGFVTDSMPINILIEKYLPLEYRKLLIPVATSGNKVVPNQRR